jgi:hypothetical protein
MRDESFSLKFYRRLLRLYPAGFRDNYAGPLERAFRDELAESSGPWALALLWIRLLADLAISIPAQVAREVYQDVRHMLRLWSSRPWHTGFAIAALAVGIGANTGVFSVVNALLLLAGIADIHLGLQNGVTGKRADRRIVRWHLADNAHPASWRVAPVLGD